MIIIGQIIGGRKLAHIAAANTFTTKELYPHTLKALDATPQDYGLAALRYDLSKLRAKQLVLKLPRSRRCQLTVPVRAYAEHVCGARATPVARIARPDP